MESLPEDRRGSSVAAEIPPTPSDLRGARVTVAGVGSHDGGVGATRYLSRHGASVLLTDLASGPLLRWQLDELRGVSRCQVLGRHRVEDFVTADWVVRSPAILDSDRFVECARAADVPVVLDLDLFLRWCPTRNIVAVSGTKGKSTTSTMIARVLQAGGFHTTLAGNIGVSPFNELDELTRDSWVVLELSSTQLAMLRPRMLPPRFAVLTNVYPSHLREHGTHERYVAAKARLFENMADGGVALISRDVDHQRRWTTAGVSTLTYGAAELPSDWRLNLLGEHNRGNAAAALMIARQLGIDDRATADALETMEPLFGRLELTATYGGVRFYNDRMAAASPATARAIRSMPGPAILIIGGRDNGFDPAPIRAVAPALVKLAVVTPSDNAPVLLEALAGAPVVHVESLAQAVEVAAVAAQPGDCVLYSSPFAFYPAPTRGALVGRFRSIDVCRRFDAEVHAWAARHGLTVSAS